MYEQDYIMRMNRDVIRTISKLILGRDMEEPMDITANELKSEDKKMLILNEQVDVEKITELEEKIQEQIVNNKERALEQALLFYCYLNKQSDEFLEANDFDKEKIARKIFEDYIRTILVKTNKFERINNDLIRKTKDFKYSYDLKDEDFKINNHKERD